MELAELTLDQKQALAAHPNDGIAAVAKELLARGGRLPDPGRQKILKQLLPLTRQRGDVKQGEQIFKKQCAKCHATMVEGTAVGPDLTGMAVHPKAELLTHLVDPSRSVEGNFHMYTVVTTAGHVVNGMVAGESKTAIELIDTNADRHTILREDIDELIASRKSLMPDGFEKQLSHDDIVNLLEFLKSSPASPAGDLRRPERIPSR